MSWFLITILLILGFSSFTVHGDRKDILESIRNTYKNQKQMRETLLEYEREAIKPGNVNPCNEMMPIFEYGEYVSIRTRINISSQVIFGDTDKKIGYSLILDDSTTIDIPAIIKCTPNTTGTTLSIGTTVYEFYLVPYGEADNFKFEVALISKEISNKFKSTFMLEAAKIVDEFLQTYRSDRTQRKNVSTWFRQMKNSSVSNQMCDAFFAILNEGDKNLEFVNNGRIIDKRPIILLITEKIEINLRGFVECEVKEVNVSGLSNNQNNNTRQYKYFTILKLEDKNNPTFSQIYSYKNVRGTKIFTATSELLQQLKEKS